VEAAAVKGLLALVMTAVPAAAWACPACANRAAPGLGVAGLVAGMIAVPYAITVVAIRVIRRLDRDGGGG
jgi:hypothetical protein